MALIEYPSLLAIGLATVGLASFALADCAGMFRNFIRWAEGMAIFYLQSIPKPLVEAAGIGRTVRRVGGSANIRGAVSAWLLPLGLAAIFIQLFSWANPIISGWLDALSWNLSFEFPPAARLLFWLAVAWGLWSFINPRLYWVAKWQVPDRKELDPGPDGRARSVFLSFVFSAEAIIRSMVLFNILFAIQNGLDLAYLWGGRTLPEGFTFATYAHRGAYPLIITALLAATFVLIAFRHRSNGAHFTLAISLMYLWIAQNVLLVGSSIWRTVIYIDQYSLTYLRVAALIWMAVVAAGLIWIILRFAWDKNNEWLLNINAVTVLGVLFASSFGDFGAIIANHNVRHSREAGGSGATLDLDYIRYIGPSALPALRWYVANVPVMNAALDTQTLAIKFENEIREGTSDWRHWTFRWHRMNKSLSTAAAAPATTPGSAPGAPVPP